MHLATCTFEEILAGKPECFAIPHEFHLGVRKCDGCAVRSECVSVNAQMFKAMSAGMIKGRSRDDLPYEQNEGQKIVHGVLHNAPNSSWHRPCKPDALSQVFDRAMRAYADRTPQPTIDDLLEGIDAEFSELNRQDVRDAGTQPTKMTASDSALESDTLFDKMPADCCDALEDMSDGSSKILASDEYDPVDALLDQVVPDALRVTVVASAAPTATQVPASYSGAASRGTHVRAPAASISSPDHTHLMEDWRVLLCAFKAAGLRDYNAIREQFIEVNFQLNQFGLWAPRFRDIPSQIADGGHVTEQYWCDRQLIDLHWLWATDYRKPCHPMEYELMLSTVPFDRAMAERFAKERWHWDTKATYLNLPPQRQWQLGIIQSENIRKQWTTIKGGDRQGGKVRQNGAAQVETILQAHTIPQHRAYIPSRVAVWMAVRICGEKKWTAASRLCALILGEEQRDPHQIQKTFDAVEKTLAKA